MDDNQLYQEWTPEENEKIQKFIKYVEKYSEYHGYKYEQKPSVNDYYNDPSKFGIFKTADGRWEFVRQGYPDPNCMDIQKAIFDAYHIHGFETLDKLINMEKSWVKSYMYRNYKKVACPSCKHIWYVKISLLEAEEIHLIPCPECKTKVKLVTPHYKYSWSDSSCSEFARIDNREEMMDLRIIQQIEDKGIKNIDISPEDLNKLFERGLLAIKRLHEIKTCIYSDLNIDPSHLVNVINQKARLPYWNDFPGITGCFEKPMGDYLKDTWSMTTFYARPGSFDVRIADEEELKRAIEIRPDLEKIIKIDLERVRKYKEKMAMYADKEKDEDE